MLGEAETGKQFVIQILNSKLGYRGLTTLMLDMADLTFFYPRKVTV